MSGRSGTATCALGANPSAIKRGRRLPYCLLLIALLLGTALLQKDGGAGFPKAQPRSRAQWAHLYAALPLSFEANRGQTDSSVNFLSRGQGYALFLTGREAVLTLNNPSSATGGQKQPASPAVLRLQLLGANAHAAVTGRDELPGKANYFLGNNPSKWHTDVSTYAKVMYQGVYPGVNLVYYGTQGGELEYDFVIAPGADPQAITLGVGAVTPPEKPNSKLQTGMPKSRGVRVDSDGDLIVPLADREVRLHKPLVYQPAAGSAERTTGQGRWTPIEGHYALDAENRVRFQLGPYDHNRPLVIDPVLSYATYIGGSGGDTGYAIAVDSNSYAYIAGVTNSANFPTAGTPYDSSYHGNGDAFVTKIKYDGTALVYSTYVGGSESDAATALALSNGSVFITGYTNSLDFPTKVPVTTAGAVPFQQANAGGFDAFVTELNTNGNALVYSTYLGGNGDDYGQGIAADSSGNAYVTGSTASTNFPAANALYPSFKGGTDAFVTEMNSTGEALVYSTYLGGSAVDVGQSIQVDGSGNAYVAGYTFSTTSSPPDPATDFPTAPSGSVLQSANAGGADAFVAELSAGGTALKFSTFLGGTGDDRAYGLALDRSTPPNIYVVGTTSSSTAGSGVPFPTTSGAYQTTLGGPGATNAFVSKLNNAGTELVYSTYLGGNGTDQGTAIAVNSSGEAYVTGRTNSSLFPTHDPIQATLGLSANLYCEGVPCPDAFITQFTADGTGLKFSTYLGGNGYDVGQGIAVDSAGDPYITGITASTNFPATSPAVPGTTGTNYVPPYKSTLVGTAGNAFVAKVDSASNPGISILPASLSFGNETVSVTSALQQITLINPSTVPLDITQILVYPVGTSNTVFTETDNCVGTINPGLFCTMNVAFTPDGTGSVSDQIYITDNAGGVAGTQQIIALSGSGVTAATAVTVNPTSLSFTSQNVGTISPAQSVTITNTGTQTLNITNISTGTTGDYSQTNTCGAMENTLAVNQSCTISVTFSPTASGTRGGTLSISDNATGSPQSVSLTGIGAAAFTLTYSSPSSYPNPTLIGNTTTEFNIIANGPTGANAFTGTISLACSAGTTCSFNPTTISAAGNAGSVSLMTVSNLTTTPSNPYIFTVTGTSGSQSTSVQVSLNFADFTLSATPSVDTISAGSNAQYKILVNPLYGFNQQVNLLLFTAEPPDTTSTFNPVSVTPNGTSAAISVFNISSSKYVETPTHLLPRLPKGKGPPLIFGLLCLAGLASLALGNRRRARHGWLGSAWLGVRLATLSLILALNLALASCRSSTLVSSGTTPGNYTLTVQGQLSANTAVVRTTVVNFDVTATAP